MWVAMKEYGRKEKLEDVLACVVLSAGIFVMTWLAFAMDVITTGM